MATWQFVYAKRFAFYPPDYDDPGLGGAEGSLVVLTRALARLGHEVSVFNCCYRPGTYDGVVWRPLHELPAAPTPDARVAVRYEESIVPVPDARNLFWMLDNRPEGVARFVERLPAHRCTVVVASQAMAAVVAAAGVRHALSIIGHPVETDAYRQADGGRPPVCLYSSIPDRGLDVALAIWPRIRAAVPDAELHVTSGYELWGFTKAEAAVLHDRVAKDATALHGVRDLGVLERSGLRDVQQTSALLLYPCREEEMFCLAVAEAAAAGTPTITSNHHALTERVDHGVTGWLIDGDIDEPDVQDEYVDAATRLLTQPELRRKMGARARLAAHDLNAITIARRWEALLAT